MFGSNIPSFILPNFKDYNPKKNRKKKNEINNIFDIILLKSI